MTGAETSSPFKGEAGRGMGPAPFKGEAGRGMGQAHLKGKARNERATTTHATSSSPSASLLLMHRRTLWITAALALVAAIAIYGVIMVPRASTEAIGSIAVLPFQTKSADTDTDYLADGLAETLIYQLSQVPKIKVTPASSVFRYKGKDVDPLKVGAELGVAAVMTGRLVQRGESLSISVELVDVRNSKSLWGEKYERKLADLLATQREIATEIARKLQLNLSGESARLLTKRFTDNNEAYQLYLKGQYQYAKRGQENLTRAIDFFQQAVRLDPSFAKAHVALADTYSIAAFNGHLNSKEVLPLAAAAAERALAIDPALAEAHAAKASVAAMDWRWEDARRGFARAIELNPDIAETRFRYGLLYLIPMKRAEEAILEIRRATELEPQAIVMAAVLTRGYLAAGKTRLALEQAKKTYALDPDHVTTLSWLMMANYAAGNYAETLELVGKLRKSFPTFAAVWAVTAYMKIGKPENAKRELRAVLDNPGLQNNALAIGLMMAAAGNRDEAFAAFERAYAAKEIRLVYLQSDLPTESLRSDPRFVDLMKRIGLPE